VPGWWSEPPLEPWPDPLDCKDAQHLLHALGWHLIEIERPTTPHARRTRVSISVNLQWPSNLLEYSLTLRYLSTAERLMSANLETSGS